ncbi:MAG TPA: MFS transporter, partial [Candidatus Binatia bacterium]|nr:MFS transporter [Candidatus Binatia bacterium]
MASTVVANSSRSPHIFYGWWMVLVTAIALTAGPILGASTFGIFVKPLAETFGWSRSAISLGFSIVAGFASLAAPIVGLFADRFGPRKVILCAALVFGSGFLSFVSLSASIW